jgi:aminoglycoside phosphotransferase (APT) family kinase protein
LNAPTDLAAAVVRMGLAPTAAAVAFTPLAGGVSSDIYRVDAGGRTFCVKRALAKLRVQADWRAPVDRNRHELDYLGVASRIVPGAFPAVLGADEQTGSFAMDYLDPARFPVWKAQLRDGTIDPDTAQRVGAILGRIHAATAGDAALAARFATDANFHALRLEPYLAATAAAHPRAADTLAALIAVTAGNRHALVHGDYSPKNILVGPDGPVILDAECAWFGDPAFDLAFVLNHLLLKGAWRPQWKTRYLACAGSLARSYFDLVAWEDRGALEERVVRLLPGLMLARIDGKSPVEYLTDETVRQHVRVFALRFLRDPAQRLYELSTAWQHYEEIR